MFWQRGRGTGYDPQFDLTRQQRLLEDILRPKHKHTECFNLILLLFIISDTVSRNTTKGKSYTIAGNGTKTLGSQ